MEASARRRLIVRTSAAGIALNLAIAAVKIVLGLISSSVAIISEGINNATDAASSLLTLVGTKLSAKHPDEKHPFGYGRIEYLTSLIIAALILYAGISMLISSIQGIISPAEMEVSVPMIIIIAVSAAAKFFLGTYTISAGKKADSSSLTAVGIDCRNDSFISIVTIVSSVIYLVSGFSLDAFAGAVFAVVIIRAGYSVLMDTVNDLLGRPGQKELADTLYREIRSTPGVINAADMMLHNYGPDSWSGSVNIEISSDKTVGDVYESIHDLQLRIMHEHKVTMVFGIYAVNQDRKDLAEIRSAVHGFIRSHEHIRSCHALYLSPSSGKIYIDFVVDYVLADWDSLRNEFEEYMAPLFPGHGVELTVETEFV